MSIVQAWLLVGVPALLLGGALFVGRSTWRSTLGYGVLGAGFAGIAVVDRGSAAVFGGLLALLLAAGRGGRGERRAVLAAEESDVPGWVGSDRTLDPPTSG